MIKWSEYDQPGRETPVRELIEQTTIADSAVPCMLWYGVIA